MSGYSTDEEAAVLSSTRSSTEMSKKRGKHYFGEASTVFFLEGCNKSKVVTKCSQESRNDFCAQLRTLPIPEESVRPRERIGYYFILFKERKQHRAL